MPYDDDPFDGSFDEADDDPGGAVSGIGAGPAARPPAPDDRLWRHPSEVGAGGAASRAGMPGAAGAPTGGPWTPPAPVGPAPRDVGRPWLVAVMAAMAGSSVTLATMLALGAFTSTPTAPAGVVKESIDLERNPDAPIALAQKVLPAVGRVDVRTATGLATGSAVMFRTDGYLMTTADLVDGAEQITITFEEGPAKPAQLVGSDRESDIAVLWVEGTDLPVAVLGHSANVQLGDLVLAIDSSPVGYGAPSIPVGVVNALGRRVESPDPARSPSLYDMLQTNLELASAGTGAPVIDSSGSVVGIVTSRGYKAPDRTALIANNQVSNTARGRGGTGELVVRFATPIDYARQVADSLLRPPGKVEHAYLGASGEAIAPDEAHRREISGGLRITTIAEGSPADTGHSPLRAGDIIVRFQDDPITSWDDLVVALRKHRPGDTASVMYLRDDATDPQPAIFTLADRPTTGK